MPYEHYPKTSRKPLKVLSRSIFHLQKIVLAALWKLNWVKI